jgi:hypothetical protein
MTVDTLDQVWTIEAGEREVLTVPVLDDTGAAYAITGWVVDACSKDRPGGTVLYTWPSNLAQVSGDGLSVVVTTPAPVSATWLFRSAWYRVKVRDPSSPVDNPNVQRLLEGALIVSPD